MSETIQAWVDEEFKKDIDVEAAERQMSTSEFIKEALESQIRGESLEDKLDLVQEELREKKEKRNKLKAEISRLESEKKSIEKRIEDRKVDDEEYSELVEEVATAYIKHNPNTFTVHPQWDSVLELANSEEEARADVEDKIESLQAGDLQ